VLTTYPKATLDGCIDPYSELKLARPFLNSIHCMFAHCLQRRRKRALVVFRS
jgi:hypothetical protein